MSDGSRVKQYNRRCQRNGDHMHRIDELSSDRLEIVIERHRGEHLAGPDGDREASTPGDLDRRIVSIVGVGERWIDVFWPIATAAMV